jgi:hypothetical protein
MRSERAADDAVGKKDGRLRWSSHLEDASPRPFAMDSLLFPAHISAGTLEENNDATKPILTIKKQEARLTYHSGL